MMQTVFEDDDRVFDSICAGASGYILKNHLNTKLIDSINGCKGARHVAYTEKCWASCSKYQHANPRRHPTTSLLQGKKKFWPVLSMDLLIK